MEEKTRDEQIRENLPLVYSTVHRRFGGYAKSHYWDDLIQSGCIGLMKAIDRFDPSLGNAFSSFAVPYISGEIMHYLRDSVQPVKTRKEIVKTVSLDKKSFDDGIPLLDVICSYTDCSREVLELNWLVDSLPPTEILFEKGRVGSAMKVLGEHSGDVLLYIAEGYSKEEVGSLYGVSGAAVSRFLKQISCYFNGQISIDN